MKMYDVSALRVCIRVLKSLMIGYEFEYFSFLIIAVLFSAGNAKKKRFHSFHRSDRHNRRLSRFNPQFVNTYTNC